jgi:hypothetical protein
MTEKEVRALLVRATEDRPPGLDLMAAIATMPDMQDMRARRQRRRVRVLAPLASLGVAAAVSVIALALPLGLPSAQAQVAAAIENTTQESYRVHETTGGGTFEGAFDPVQRVGVIKESTGGTETRFVGDTMYNYEPAQAKWIASPRPDAELMQAAEVIAVVKLADLDPQQALQRLQSASDIREDGAASGQGWTGRRFAFSFADVRDGDGQTGTSETVTGSVDVDEQGRVRRLEFDFVDGQRNVTEFSDFGAPVTVTAPPAGDVIQQPADEKGAGKPAGVSTDEKARGDKTGGDKGTDNATEAEKAAKAAKAAEEAAGKPVTTSP